MDSSEGLTAATVLVVVAVAVASGPLVGAVDLTSEPTVPAPPGQGSADVEVVDVPRTVVLERGDFGSGTYHFAGPDARISVGAVSGNPIVEYVVHVPALDLTDIKEYEIRETPNRQLALRFRPVEVSPSRVDQSSYEGRIEIRLQSDEFETIYDEPVTVEVRG